GSMTGPSPFRVAAVVAAHNEEAGIARVVRSLYHIGGVERVMVVADGSTDRTVDEARSAGAWVLCGTSRAGKGRAVDAAVARLPWADAFVLVDGDVGETAGEVAVLLDSVRSGRFDLAIGRLPPAEGGGLGLVKRAAAW